MKQNESARLYGQRVNQVIDHIKDHLTDSLPIAELAALAHFSPFHFHRIFRSVVGEPLHAFIRRLRLERAVFRLLHGPKETLTAIAMHSGFASSSDFSRAFKQAYGFAPREFSRGRLLEESKIRQDLLANAGYGFGKLPEKGNPDRFRVRVIERPRRLIAYERVIGSFDIARMLAAFDRLMVWGRSRGLAPSAPVIGRPLDDLETTPMKKFRFDWCLLLPEGFEAGRDVSIGEIPGGQFAVVRCVGDIHKEDRAWKYLFHSWLPGSGYHPTDEPTLEVYRKHPSEIGWETFDIDCCLPVKPLRRR